MLSLKEGVFIFLMLFCCSIQNISSEIFTAQVELEALFELRQSVADGIKTYLDKEELRLQEIRNKFISSSGLNRIDCANENRNSEHRKSSLAEKINPINSFLTIKGLSKDLGEILLPALDKSNIQEFNDLIHRLNKEYTFPDNNDIKGAAVAMIRLQDTYKLSTNNVSKGCLTSNFCTTKLAVDDCFELGKQSYLARNYDHAIDWMNEALAKLEEEEAIQSYNVTHSNSYASSRHSLRSHETSARNLMPDSNVRTSKEDILEYLAWAENIKSTVEMGKKLMNDMTGIELESFIDGILKITEGRMGAGDSYKDVFSKYEALCRGERKESQSSNPNLKCSYRASKDLYYVIGPVKQEVVSQSPMILVFHDVIHENEIKRIQQLAIPNIETAKVINVATGGNQMSTARVSKSAWLLESDDKVVERIHNRVGYLTDLDMKTAEELQIANYGIGGMYEPHFDFAHTDQASFLSEDGGNRIATLMFYLSDVTAGGATVFPSLELSIWPKKGSAVFWHNLMQDGTGDFRTRHAACPVLIGSKWVANKWIHEMGQEWRRPCGLHPSV